MSTATFTEAMVWLRREICAQQEWMPKPKGFLGFGFLGTVLQQGIFQNEYLTRGFSCTCPNAFPTVFYMTEGYRIHQTRHKLIHFPRVRDFWHLNSCEKRLVSTRTGEQRGSFLHGGSCRSAALIDPIIQNTGWLGYDWSWIIIDPSHAIIHHLGCTSGRLIHWCTDTCFSYVCSEQNLCVLGSVSSGLGISYQMQTGLPVPWPNSTATETPLWVERRATGIERTQGLFGNPEAKSECMQTVGPSQLCQTLSLHKPLSTNL